ncbi:hypothetical protein SO802_026218 [Lithocarpus litseifolius]|uniref:FAD-binding domain-containing protein n=1 Tax=Lithocarpus litseifolius TaxID=425828 RepID=A0AAW2C135_9ROSI
MEEQDVVIVGAGIAGLATAVALKRVGVGALVLEKSEGLRATGAALGLHPNAWLALDALGVSHKLTTTYAPCRKRNVTNVDTGATQQVPSTEPNKNGHELRIVRRKALLEALAEELPTETIRYSSKLNSIVTQVEEGSSYAIIHMENGVSIKAKVNRNYIRAGFFPLNEELYWFLTNLPSKSSRGEDIAHDPELIKKEVISNFAKNFPASYLRVVQHLDLSTVTWAPLMFRFPWDVIIGNLSKGNITVASDAMHPMTPDLGQGGCSALEDAVVLGRHIGNLVIKTKSLWQEIKWLRP